MAPPALVLTGIVTTNDSSSAADRGQIGQLLVTEGPGQEGIS